MAVFTAARMTALRPGQSPPPVRIPIRCIVSDIAQTSFVVSPLHPGRVLRTSCGSSLFGRRGARPVPSLAQTLPTDHGAVLQDIQASGGTKHVWSHEHFVVYLDNLSWSSTSLK